MAQFKNMYKVELNNGIAPVVSLKQIYYADVEANRIGAIVTMNGQPFPLSGTCTGSAILADGSTVPMAGVIDGNQAYIDLDSSCYSVEGQIRIFVKITTGGVTTTLLAAVGTVQLTETDTVIDPGTIIPSVSALITAIEDAVESIPADYTALLETIAPMYANLTFPVKAGQWCWYSGVLYEANQDISTSENWTAAHWKTTTVGGSVSELKSALDSISEKVDDVSELTNENGEILDLLLGEHELIYSPNLYDASKQTSETISPHYYVNGVPYGSTTLDAQYNCTALIPVEPNTTYTVGLVPPVSTTLVNNVVKPWNEASQGWFAYDANGDYISGSGGSENTFTTVANAKYIRFNYYIRYGTVSLTKLNARCMLVKGETLPETYKAYGDDTLQSELQTRIENIENELNGIGCEYKFSGDSLLLSYGYNDTYDCVVVMNAGRANGLFDFSKLCLKPKGESLNNYEESGLTVVWTSDTDMHGPFKFNAVNNADGYHADATTAGWVGGNHTLSNLGAGFETATSKYIRYFADGRPVSSGYGRCCNFEVRWANDVQAYNTVKEGGGGRACLTEYHDMIFDGVKFNETVELSALESIKMELWYGFQLVGWKQLYTNIHFIEGTNRHVYVPTDGTDGDVRSGNLLTSGIEAWGTDHKIILTVNNYYDLGKREKVSNTQSKGAFTSSHKGYFTIIDSDDFVMETGQSYYMRGSFRFCPEITVVNS